MPQPTNFLAALNQPNLTAQLLGDLGGALQQRKLRIAQEEQVRAAQAKQTQTDETLSNFRTIQNPTFQDYQKVITLMPKERADQLTKEWGLLSKDQQTNQLKFSGQVMAAFNANPEVAITMLENRAEAERNAGDEEEASQYERWALIAEENPEAVMENIGMIISALPGGKDIIDSVSAIRGRGPGAAEKPSAPVTLVNEETGEKILHTPVFNPATGKARLEPADLPEGFSLSKETATEKRQAEIATVGAKKGAEVTGKGQAERRQVTIKSGVDSSEGLANLKRARSLLETVKTGGINAASLRAKQLFGVEGADEGELSNRLGKAVLSQLRTTFGAAFTAQEGASLTRIEAGFGKSPGTNKRLLDKLIKMVEKKSQQGIKAAVVAEDFEAAQLIKDNMTFTLDEEIVAEGDLTQEEQAELNELRRTVK